MTHLPLCGEGGNIVWLRVFDACILRTADIAAGDHIPQRNMMSQQQPLFIGNRARDRLPQHGGKHAPEAILRVAVEERGLARFDRRKGAEDQHPGIRVIERRDRMNDVLRQSARPSASMASSVVAHEVTNRTAVCVSQVLAFSSKSKPLRSSSIFRSGRMGKS